MQCNVLVLLNDESQIAHVLKNMCLQGTQHIMWEFLYEMLLCDNFHTPHITYIEYKSI